MGGSYDFGRFFTFFTGWAAARGGKSRSGASNAPVAATEQKCRSCNKDRINGQRYKKELFRKKDLKRMSENSEERVADNNMKSKSRIEKKRLLW